MSYTRKIGCDLELFRSNEASFDRRPPAKTRAINWALGFGPVGGERPIWGLYRLVNRECVVTERELFWRWCPSELELFRWCTRSIDVQLATRLIEGIGDVANFYDRYFALRPELAAVSVEQSVGYPTLVINAPTAKQAIDDRLGNPNTKAEGASRIARGKSAQASRALTLR